MRRKSDKLAGGIRGVAALAALLSFAACTQPDGTVVADPPPPVRPTASEIPKVDWKAAKPFRMLVTEYVFAPQRPVFTAGTAYRLELLNTGEQTHVITGTDFFNAIAVKKVEVTAWAAHGSTEHTDTPAGPEKADGVPKIPEIKGNVSEVNRINKEAKIRKAKDDAAKERMKALAGPNKATKNPFAAKTDGKDEPAAAENPFAAKPEEEEGAANPFAEKSADEEPAAADDPFKEDIAADDEPAAADDPFKDNPADVEDPADAPDPFQEDIADADEEDAVDDPFKEDTAAANEEPAEADDPFKEDSAADEEPAEADDPFKEDSADDEEPAAADDPFKEDTAADEEPAAADDPFKEDTADDEEDEPAKVDAVTSKMAEDDEPEAAEKVVTVETDDDDDPLRDEAKLPSTARMKPADVAEAAPADDAVTKTSEETPVASDDGPWDPLDVKEISIPPGHKAIIEFVAVHAGEHNFWSGNFGLFIFGMSGEASIVPPEPVKTAAVEETASE